MATIVNLGVVLAQKRMGVTELSEKVGITMANISTLKSGETEAICFPIPEKICQVLGYQLGDLLTYKNDSNITPEEQSKVEQSVSKE